MKVGCMMESWRNGMLAETRSLNQQIGLQMKGGGMMNRAQGSGLANGLH